MYQRLESRIGLFVCVSWVASDWVVNVVCGVVGDPGGAADVQEGERPRQRAAVLRRARQRQVARGDPR